MDASLLYESCSSLPARYYGFVKAIRVNLFNFRNRNSAKLENRLENNVKALKSGKDQQPRGPSPSCAGDAMKEPGRRVEIGLAQVAFIFYALVLWNLRYSSPRAVGNYTRWK